MQLHSRYSGFDISPGVQADLDRLAQLWTLARDRHGAAGPWLFGDYSLADVFFAPIAARLAGYGLSAGPVGDEYVALHLADTGFRQWRALGLLKSYDPVPYALDLPVGPWPGPAPLSAKPVDGGPCENALCPYSAKVSAHFLALEGRVFGFCNPVCRDKTVNDPAAWPAFMEIYHS